MFKLTEREVVLVMLDDLLLAIHEVDVVAKEQMEIFSVRPWQSKLNGIELQEQVIPKRPNQDQP